MPQHITECLSDLASQAGFQFARPALVPALVRLQKLLTAYQGIAGGISIGTVGQWAGDATFEQGGTLACACSHASLLRGLVNCQYVAAINTDVLQTLWQGKVA